MTSSFRHQLISEVVGGGAAGSWLEPAGNVELVILFGDLIYILEEEVRRTLCKR